MTVMLATIGAATAVTLYVADSKSKVKELEAKLQAEKELRAKDVQAEKELRAKDMQAQEGKLQAEKELRAKDVQAEKELRAKDVQAARSDAESFTMQKLFAAGFAAEYEAYREKIAEETSKRMAVKGKQ